MELAKRQGVISLVVDFTTLLAHDQTDTLLFFDSRSGEVPPSSSTAPGVGSLLPRVKADTEPREALKWRARWVDEYVRVARCSFPVLSLRAPGFWGSGVLSRVRPFPSFVLLLLLVFCSPGFWVSGGVFPAGGDIPTPSAAHCFSASRLEIARSGLTLLGAPRSHRPSHL